MNFAVRELFERNLATDTDSGRDDLPARDLARPGPHRSGPAAVDSRVTDLPPPHGRRAN